MAYNSTGLIVHDADAHIMETPHWLRDHADAAIRDRLEKLSYPGGNELVQSAVLVEDQADLDRGFERLAEQHRSEEYRAAEEAELMSRKNFAATGSFLAEDRPRVLDMLGFASQLVFNTFHNALLRDWEHGGDIEFAIGAARAHNRGMAEFCSVDSRLLSTLYVPLADIDRAPALAREAIEMGAIWVPSWMRQMESAMDAFSRHEERLQNLSMRPSDYVKRQMRFTPYPTEDVGWIIEQAGSEIPMFSSDYPHVEGGRRPIERFERSLEGCSSAAREAFYHHNFADLMGGRLDVVLAA